MLDILAFFMFAAFMIDDGTADKFLYRVSLELSQDMPRVSGCRRCVPSSSTTCATSLAILLTECPRTTIELSEKQHLTVYKRFAFSVSKK